MDEHLDDELKRRISKVFEDYSEPPADEGWLLLREKFPGEEKKRGAFWLWTGMAAALLLLLGIGVLLFNRNEKPAQQMALNTKKTGIKDTASSEKANAETIAGTQNSKTEAVNKAQNTTDKQNTPEQTLAASLANNSTIDAHINATRANKRGVKQNNSLPGVQSTQQYTVASNQHNKPDQNITIAQGTQPAAKQNVQSTLQNQAKSLDITPQNYMAATAQQPANDAAKHAADSAKNAPVIANNPTPDKSIISMFKNDNKTQLSNKALSPRPLGHSVRFGVYAATFFNYAKGSDNRINGGAGIASDIRLSKKLHLSTGVLIAQNSFNYNYPTSVPTAAVPMSFAAANTTIRAAASFGSYFPTKPVFKNYDASLVNLDVPVNLKYDVGNRKHEMFVSAGLSSGTFINERYNFSYATPTLLDGTVQQPKTETTTQNFNSFYFGKVVNMSFGIGYPVGNNHITIEPFFKYPLDGLGAQNIKFGSGGVNLKFNFSGLKK